MNIQVDVCPEDHGVFVGAEHIRHLVRPDTADQIQGLASAGESELRGCPDCRLPLREFEFDEVPASGCARCGGLWFDSEALRARVSAVRRRQFGVNSFAARADVLQAGEAFYPAEVVAGLLADFELELTD